MTIGDPMNEDSDIGTLVDEVAACRVKSWDNEAVSQGATILTSSVRKGAAYLPTVLTNVNHSMKVVCEEVFGPVVCIMPYSALSEPVEAINAGAYGLQCGVYTNSTTTATDLYKTIRTGGVMINGTSTWRIDQLAYGGVKDSGIGREGPRYAIQNMTEERLVLFNI